MAIAKVTGCINNDCDDKISSGIGETATTCYKTQVCNTSPDKNLELTGTIWPVIYYNQNVENDDALWNHDNYSSPVYQNYVKINNFPIILDGSITPTVVGENRVVSATATGRAPALRRLHAGDTIVGPVGSKMYMFNVTEVIPTSIDNTGWNNITFTLIGPAGTGIEKYDNLEEKVMTTLIFDKEYGLLTEDANADRKDLLPFLKSAVKNYMNRMLNDQGVLMLRHGSKFVYDPEMTKLVASMNGMLGNCGSPVSGPTPERSGGTYLTDILLERSLGLTSNMCRTRCMVLVDSANVSSSDYIQMTVMTDYVVGDDYVFLQDRDHHQMGAPCPPIDDEPTDPPTPPASTCMTLDAPCCGCVEDPLNDVNTNYGRTVELDAETIPIIKDPFIDDNYILSEAFYTGDKATMSYLERMVNRYIHNEAISIADLLVLWNDVVHWCSHSWFYYMPLLILLSKYAMSNRGQCEIKVGE